MAFLELFLFLLFVLAAVFIIRVAVRKWRQAGIVGTMRQIEETEEAADAVRRFKNHHRNPGADRDEVDKFTKG